MIRASYARWARSRKGVGGGVAGPGATPGLFFEMPAGIIGGAKKSFAHYFGPYPRSFDNLNPITSALENYREIFNNPFDNHVADPAGNRSVVFGGQFRDRPQPRVAFAGDYVLEDCKVDVRQAREVGLDGFFPDMLGLSGANWDRYVKLAAAADALHPDGSFKVVPMIDGNGSHAAATAAVCAASIKQFANRPCSWTLPDGRWVCAIFKPEAKTKAYWDSVAAALLSTWGITVAWLGSYVTVGSRTSYPNHWGSGPWGYHADPAIVNAATNLLPSIRGAGQKMLAPIVPQDVRPLGIGVDPLHGLYDNAVGMRSLVATCKKAVAQDADYLQLVTWNDYSETPSAPSANNGWAILEVFAYHNAAFKNGGVYPTIILDAVYLSHRNQRTTAPLSSGQSITMKQWPVGSMTVEGNQVEVLTYLKASSTVTVNVGAVVSTYTAPAGEFSNLVTGPAAGVSLSAGSISVSVSRTGEGVVATVVSPIPFYASPVNDDRGYYRMSSVRGTSGQYVPHHQTPVLPSSYTLAP